MTNIHDAKRAVFLLVIGLLVWKADPLTRNVFLSLIVTLSIMLFALPLVPGFINVLANKPDENRPKVDIQPGSDAVETERQLANVGPYEPSTFAFFTFIAPGQIKAIIRGESFRRFIMRFEGHAFRGETKSGRAEGLKVSSREFWDIVKTDKSPEVNDKDAHPIPRAIRKGYFDLSWWWSRYVYDITGAVFIGIPPFQTAQVYELERFRKALGLLGDFIFIRVKNFSDHVRAAEFQFFVQIPSAETHDQAKVKLQFALTVVVKNPYRALYDTDLRWSSRLSTAVIQAVSARVRELDYKQVIAQDATTKSSLDEAVIMLNAIGDTTSPNVATRTPLLTIGLEVKEIELLDAEVNDPILAAHLADVAKATADAEARIKRGTAEAAVVEMTASAAQKHGPYGELALRIEGNVRTTAAASAKGSTVILTVGGDKGSAIGPDTALLQQAIERNNQ